MRIALDAMGGDYAPQEIVAGAIQAAKESRLEIVLVGEEQVISRELKKYPSCANISVYHASEVIAMDEEPALALRKKKDASIVVATKLVKDGYADAVVSAGSTGAQMASSLLGLGRIKGILRPAIATVFPTLQGGKLILDVGANADCKPANLVQFARMGAIYAEKVMGIQRPKVGLLNIGSEETKGNELAQETFRLLTGEDLNFIGNIEARYIPYGEADVVVCDGFVGNTILKLAEGLAGALFTLIKQEVEKDFVRKIGGMLVRSAFKDIKKTMDYAEYGGAPLLGIEGVSIICHGSSKARAIKNAIHVAQKCIENQFVSKLREAIAFKTGKEETDE
ncbi:phosphate acyltransferase PlsX [Zhaonella formicivorans]|uniref:phosphate acyltransferase PlsX n=1 Tax=Zhaonella formicivorans TaxID=2528593 RepID=UPI0010DC6A27|nr:phosphate acyltransferase PlsX [Zhaonella formicivorans]